ncbi:MAG: hypothetical protein ACSHXB_19280 [Sulfitobacter sp.]
MHGLLRLSYFFWIVVPVALYIVYATFGLPHAIWSYEFRNNGNPYDPFLERFYTSCTFWGPTGMHTIPASNGRCGYVAFFKQEVD